MNALPILVTDPDLAHHLAYGIATDRDVYLETNPDAVDDDDAHAEWANEDRTVVHVRFPYLNWGMDIGMEINPADPPKRQREDWDDTGNQVAGFAQAPGDFIPDEDALPPHVADALL